MRILKLSAYCYPEQEASSHLTEDLYEAYIRMIAYAEYECHTDKIIYSGCCGEKGPFAFSTRNDIMSMINL